MNRAKKGLLRGAILLACWMALPQASYAYTFIDFQALVQRGVQILQHMEQWRAYRAQFSQFENQFNSYKTDFLRYYTTIQQVHRQVERGQWEDFLSTVWHSYENNLGTGNIKEYFRHLNDVEPFKNNLLYRESNDYRRVQDEALAAEKGQLEKLSLTEKAIEGVEAAQQARTLKIRSFEAVNERISAGDGQASLAQQLALLNALNIEALKQGHETATLLRLLLKKSIEEQLQVREAIARKAQADSQRVQNLKAIQPNISR